MTANNLKNLYEQNSVRKLFFDERTMEFFGDTMRNFSVKDGGKIKCLTDKGIVEVEVWDLVRERPVNGGLHGHCAYFRKDNYQVVVSHE